MARAIRVLPLLLAGGLFPPLAPAQPPRGIVEGEVVDISTGRAIPGARVRLRSSPDDPIFATADDQGRFRFSGLPLKSYELAAHFPGFIPSDARAARNGVALVSLNRASTTADVNLEMQPYAVITGTVTDAFGVPVAGLTVEALQRFPAGERHSSCGPSLSEPGYQYVAASCVRTDDRGEYRLAPLAPGPYYVYVQSDYEFGSTGPISQPHDPLRRATLDPSALHPADAKEVAATPGKEVRADIRLIRGGGVKVAGRVTGVLENAPGRYTRVGLRHIPPATASGGSADVVAGSFVISDVLPGRYLIAAVQYAPGSIGQSDVLSYGSRTIDVGDEDIAGIDLSLAPTPDITGEIVFQEGCRSAPVFIQIQSASYHHEVHVIASDGRFVFRHLVPDRYNVYAVPDGAAPLVPQSATLGGVDVLHTGFDITAGSTGPLRILMGCRWR